MPRIRFVGEGGSCGSCWVPEGRTVLEAALDLGVPMHHVCNGGGTCSTCRVRVVTNPSHLSPIEPNEVAYDMGPDVRLGCQARIRGDVAVELVPIPGALLE